MAAASTIASHQGSAYAKCITASRPHDLQARGQTAPTGVACRSHGLLRASINLTECSSQHHAHQYATDSDDEDVARPAEVEVPNPTHQQIPHHEVECSPQHVDPCGRWPLTGRRGEWARKRPS